MADFEVFPSADWESTLSDLGLISEMSVFHPLPPYTSDMFDSLSPESISMTPESLGLYDNPFSHQLTPMKDTELRKNKLTSTLENDTQERTISESQQEEITNAAQGLSLSSSIVMKTKKISKQHICHHLEKVNHQCTICGQCFLQRCHLQIHKHTHIKKIFKCRTTHCPVVISTLSRFSMHKHSNGTVRPYSCAKCGKTFSRSYYLNVHLKSHSMIKTFKCKLCNRLYKHKWHRNTHYILSHRSQDRASSKPVVISEVVDDNIAPTNPSTELFSTPRRVIKCHKCNKVFTRVYHLTRHNRAYHLPTTGSVFHCEKCNQVFNTQMALNSHMITHQDILPYPCEDCGSRYSHLSNLTIHKRTHSVVKPFACCKCERTFIQASDLRRHFYFVHEKQKKTQAEENDMRQGNVGKMLSDITSYCHPVHGHVVDVHHDKDVELFISDQGYSSLNDKKTSLAHSAQTDKVHIEVSSVEMYRCDICEQTFGRSFNMMRHRKKHGIMEGPPCFTEHDVHSCTICHKQFNKKYNMLRHMNSHSMEKPHKCTVCTKSFRRKETLELHNVKHTDLNAV